MRQLDYSCVSGFVLSSCWDIWVRLALGILNSLSRLGYVHLFFNQLCLFVILILYYAHCHVYCLLRIFIWIGILYRVARLNSVIIGAISLPQQYGYWIKLITVTVLCLIGSPQWIWYAYCVWFMILSSFVDLVMLFHKYHFILFGLSCWEIFDCFIWETCSLFPLVDHFVISLIYAFYLPCYFSWLLIVHVYIVSVLS